MRLSVLPNSQWVSQHHLQCASPKTVLFTSNEIAHTLAVFTCNVYFRLNSKYDCNCRLTFPLLRRILQMATPRDVSDLIDGDLLPEWSEVLKTPHLYALKSPGSKLKLYVVKFANDGTNVLGLRISTTCKRKRS